MKKKRLSGAGLLVLRAARVIQKIDQLGRYVLHLSQQLVAPTSYGVRFIAGKPT
jgi:hypothetical protein